VKIPFIVAGVLTTAYVAMISLLNSGAETADQRYARKNQRVIASYATANPPVVFAGSSLTAGLHFYELDSCVFNIGLIGESALTGMDLIHRGPLMPKLVYVEINFPEREKNTTLLNNTGSLFARVFPNFIYVSPLAHFANLLVGSFQRFRVALFSSNVESGNLTQPVIGKETRESELAIQRDFFKLTLTNAVLNSKLTEFAIIVRQLQKRGVRVVLLEVPIHPELESTPRSNQIRRAFMQAFPDLEMIHATSLAYGLKIQTADGLHLNDEDSKGVFSNLRGELARVCEKSLIGWVH
jgi:hypothetical protein